MCEHRIDAKVHSHSVDLCVLFLVYGLEYGKCAVLGLLPICLLCHHIQPVDVELDVSIQTTNMCGVVLELVKVLDVLDIVFECDHIVSCHMEWAAHHCFEHLHQLCIVKVVVS